MVQKPRLVYAQNDNRTNLTILERRFHRKAKESKICEGYAKGSFANIESLPAD